jgi:hypothetical protein
VVRFFTAEFLDDTLEDPTRHLRAEWSLCSSAQAVEHVAFTRWVVNRCGVDPLDFSNLVHELQALPQETEDLTIDGVDLLAQRDQFGHFHASTVTGSQA